ncbi:MAG: hypothetical protein ACJ75S_08640 [Solirubrobacterales bacterium]
MSLPDTLTPAQLGVLILELGGPADENKIATAIGVCTGESGRRASNSGTQGNSPPSTDRGGWMFNSYWHDDVSDECAYDWICSTREMLKNSNNCSDFGQWYAYHPGVGDPYTGSARRAIKAFRAGNAAQVLGSRVASAGGPGRGGGTEASASSPAGAKGGGGLVSDSQRSGLLKALLWVVVVLGGAALTGLGLTHMAKAEGAS